MKTKSRRFDLFTAHIGNMKIAPRRSYSLKPLPLGKKDMTTEPDINKDGIFFSDYKEGVPGVQPERVGPYCTTFNPGYYSPERP